MTRLVCPSILVAALAFCAGSGRAQDGFCMVNGTVRGSVAASSGSTIAPGFSIGTLAVVSPVNPTPTNLTISAVGGDLQVAWPADHIGWLLEAQTNDPGAGLTGNWLAVPGSVTTNQISIPTPPTKGSAF